MGVEGDPAANFLQKGLGHQCSKAGVYAGLRWHVGKAQGVSARPQTIYVHLIDFSLQEAN